MVAELAELDVFASLGDHLVPKWLGCPDSLQKACELMSKTRLRCSGAYFVFSQYTHRQSFYKVDSHSAISPLEKNQNAVR
jgi:hypothetical protein